MRARVVNRTPISFNILAHPARIPPVHPLLPADHADEGVCGYLRQSALSAVSPELSLQLFAYDSELAVAAAGSGAFLPPTFSDKLCTTK